MASAEREAGIGHEKGREDRAATRRPEGELEQDLAVIKATVRILEKTGRLSF
jgi:hypothetical protein